MMVGTLQDPDCRDAMSGAVSVSIIICTRNRAASLQRTLQALGNLELIPSLHVEIIVVDNGSTDGTRAVVSDCAREARPTVRYEHEARPGLSVARNRGIAAASGTLLLFTDDDCLPDRTWVTSAVRVTGGNLMQVIGGRVELYDDRDLPVTIKTSPVREQFTSHAMLQGFMHGCNMIIGRQVFDRIGLFDVRLGAGTGLAAAEDTDLIYRAFKANIPVSYDPGPVVFHDHGRTDPAELDRLMRGYMLGYGALAMKCLLGGDKDPAKTCWWALVRALRQWRNGQGSLSQVLIEGFTVVGSTKFLCGPSLRNSV